MPSQCDPQRSAASISHSIKPLAGTKRARLDNVAPIVLGGGRPAMAVPTPMALRSSAGAHLDSPRRLLWCARQSQREHALLQLSLNAGGVDLLRQLELPEETR